MSKRMLSLSKLTDDQLTYLAENYKLSYREVVALAVDRLYQSVTKDEKLPAPDQTIDNPRGNFPDRVVQHS